LKVERGGRLVRVYSDAYHINLQKTKPLSQSYHFLVKLSMI